MNKELQVSYSWKWNGLTFTIRDCETYLYRTSWIILVEGEDCGSKVFTKMRINRHNITKEDVQEYYTKWHKPATKIYESSIKMKNMNDEIFNASKAREMSKNSYKIEDQLIFICSEIKTAAKQGKEEVLISTDSIPGYYINGAYLEKALYDLDYRVNYVDEYMRIKW